MGRDTLYGPGIAELDFSALKNIRVTERMRLQFRAELFNILNRANFGDAEHSGLYFGYVRSVSYRWRDHFHVHHIAADPVRAEAALVERPITRAPR